MHRGHALAALTHILPFTFWNQRGHKNTHVHTASLNSSFCSYCDNRCPFQDATYLMSTHFDNDDKIKFQAANRFDTNYSMCARHAHVPFQSLGTVCTWYFFFSTEILIHRQNIFCLGLYRKTFFNTLNTFYFSKLVPFHLTKQIKLLKRSRV